jgi:signal transduction histidine kinase
MNQAVKSERSLTRQKLLEAYRGHLGLAQERLDSRLGQASKDTESNLDGKGPAAAFAFAVRSGLADTVICLDSSGNVTYPLSTAVPRPKIQNPEWDEARSLESISVSTAAKAFARIAETTTNATLAARALQAQVRCLLQAGQKDNAASTLKRLLGENKFGTARDAQDRLIAADQELMALEQFGPSEATDKSRVLESLKQRLLNYENDSMPSSQRRFLMRELQRLFPGLFEFPTLPAEDLAAQFLEEAPVHVGEPGMLRPSPVKGLWQMTSEHGRVLMLHHTDKLEARLASWAPSQGFPADVNLILVPPGKEAAELLLPTQAGAALPGWRMALSLKDKRLFDNAADERIASYVWIGVLVLASVVVLALLLLRLFRRQMALTRLRNDLVANVTHELKTPLSSMRLLVETLLHSPRFDPQTTREYLELIEQENRRLSRLIDNFLTFSRIERNKYTFDFRKVALAKIVEGASQAVRERFNAPGCHFEVQAASDLPAIMADADAVVTAVVNLLDNAYKYSGEEKQITLSASTRNGTAQVSVKDNGIGLSPRDSKRIFKRFFQVDQRLSRTGGGCGLGLSIVKFIITAHRGAVRVESQPGRGSTFTIDLPVAGAGESSEART